MARHIRDDWWKEGPLEAIAEAFALTGQFEEALAIAGQIDSETGRKKAFQAYAQAVARLDNPGRVLAYISRSWVAVTRRSDILCLLGMARPLIVRHPDLGLSFARAFGWVDDFLRG